MLRPGSLQASPIRAEEDALASNNEPLRRLLSGSVDRPPPDDPDDEERPSNAEDGARRRARRLAQAALKLYGLRDAEVDLLRHGFVLVFRVRSASRGEFALRLYGLPGGTRQPDPEHPSADPGSLTAAMLRSPRVLDSQLRWLSDLGHDTGLPVPEPLRTLDGELVGRVTVEGTPWRRHSALVRWVPGVHKGEDLTEADLLRVGSFVGRMHDHAERATPRRKARSSPAGTGTGRSGRRRRCGARAASSTPATR